MMEVAEVSLATFKRDIAKLRDQMGMPILFDKDRGGYFLDRNNLSDRNAGTLVQPRRAGCTTYDSTLDRAIGTRPGWPEASALCRRN
jgi:hypothetical protein